MNGFNQFWSILPAGTRLKTGKKSAERAWINAEKAFKGGFFAAAAVKAMEAQLESGHFNLDSGKTAYPMAASWLNGERWTDSINGQGKNTPKPPEREKLSEAELHQVKLLNAKKKQDAELKAKQEEQSRMKQVGPDGLPFKPLSGDKFGNAAARGCLQIGSLIKRGPRAWQRWLAAQTENPNLQSQQWMDFIVEEFKIAGITPEDYPKDSKLR